MTVEENAMYLKLLSPEDITQAYVNWMRDEEVVEFLESRWKAHTLDDLKDYIDLMNDGHSNFLFGIFLKENDEHIGNIKIGEINQIHRFGYIGILIGNKKMWGKGYGTKAIKMASQYAFEELNLNKLVAGIYANNEGSYSAFIKAGYRKVGMLINHRYYKGKYVDEILVEKLNILD